MRPIAREISEMVRSRIGKASVACPGWGRSRFELDAAFGLGCFEQPVALRIQLQKSASPTGAIAEQFGVETNGCFVGLADLYGNGLDDLLAGQVERGRKKLADVGFLPAIVNPVLVGLARGILILADAVNRRVRVRSGPRALVDACDYQHQNACNELPSPSHSRRFAFIGGCSSPTHHLTFSQKRRLTGICSSEVGDSSSMK